MLIHVSKNNMVEWHNLCISENGARRWCTSTHTLWISAAQLPEVGFGFTFDDVVMHYSTTEGLFYEYPEEDEPLYNDAQLIMQELTDIELLILEGGLS